MAPDLNQLPPSPRPSSHIVPNTSSSLSSSRRPSQPSSAPLFPLISPGISHAMAVPPVGDNTAVDTGPGPLRHPRPLTAAELHLQLEKEQEAVVNRLTRELSLLRAQQSASVVSTTSSTSTSAGISDLPPDASTSSANTAHLLSGAYPPPPSHRPHHRSSSSTSSRSFTTPATTTSTSGSIVSGSTASWTTAGQAGSVIAPPRHPTSTASTATEHPQRPSTREASVPVNFPSRQNSTTSSLSQSCPSGASSPSMLSSAHSSFQPTHEHFPPRDQAGGYSFPPHNRFSLSPSHPQHGGVPVPSHDDAVSVYPSPHQREQQQQQQQRERAEFEATKRENEALKRRVRELERVIDSTRQVPGDEVRTEAPRNERVAGGASAGVGAGTGGRGTATSGETERESGGAREGEDESVRVGESARSVGVEWGH